MKALSSGPSSSSEKVQHCLQCLLPSRWMGEKMIAGEGMKTNPGTDFPQCRFIIFPEFFSVYLQHPVIQTVDTKKRCFPEADIFQGIRGKKIAETFADADFPAFQHTESVSAFDHTGKHEFPVMPCPVNNAASPVNFPVKKEKGSEQRRGAQMHNGIDQNCFLKGVPRLRGGFQQGDGRVTGPQTEKGQFFPCCDFKGIFQHPQGVFPGLFRGKAARGMSVAGKIERNQIISFAQQRPEPADLLGIISSDQGRRKKQGTGRSIPHPYPFNSIHPLLQSSCFKHRFQTITPFFKSVSPLTPNAADLRKTVVCKGVLHTAATQVLVYAIRPLRKKLFLRAAALPSGGIFCQGNGIEYSLP